MQWKAGSAYSDVYILTHLGSYGIVDSENSYYTDVL